MKYSRSSAVLVTAAILVAACSDNRPTEPTRMTAEASVPTAARSGLLAGAITSAITGTVTNLLGTLGSFTGTATLVGFALNSAGDLVANIRVVGNAVVGGVTTAINTVVQVPVASTACSLLDLDVGAIHLNLLGLVLNTAPIHLDLTAQPGPGQLLGNLLCAIVHLLDGANPGNAVAALLRHLNDLLGAV